MSARHAPSQDHLTRCAFHISARPTSGQNRKQLTEMKRQKFGGRGPSRAVTVALPPYSALWHAPRGQMLCSRSMGARIAARRRRALPRLDPQTGARSTVSTMIVCVLNWDGEPNDVARIVIDEDEFALQVTRKSAHQLHAKAGALRAYRIYVRSQAHSIVHYFDDQAVGRLPAARDPNRSWLAGLTSMLDRIGQRLTDQQADLRRAFGGQNNP